MSSLKICSFCGKGPAEGVKVISGDAANICAECAENFKELIRVSSLKLIKVSLICSFCHEAETPHNTLVMRHGTKSICKMCASRASALIREDVI